MPQILIIGDRQNEGKPGVPFSKGNTYLIQQLAQKAFAQDSYSFINIEQLEKLNREVKDANILIASGQKAFQFLTGEKKLDNYRGYVTESSAFPGKKVLSVYDPAIIHKKWADYYHVTEMDFKKAKKHSADAIFPEEKRNFLVGVKPKEFVDYCRLVPSGAVLAFDIESNGGHISWIGFAHNKNFAINFKFLSGNEPAHSEKDELAVWQALAELFSREDIIFVAQNGQYDSSVLYKRLGILPKVQFDTMLAHHALRSNLPKSLQFQSSYWLDIPAWKHTAQGNMGLYNAEDCAATRELYDVLRAELDKERLWRSFNALSNLVESFTYIGLRGFKIDQVKRKEMLQKTLERVKILEDKMDKSLGLSCFNYKSSKQMIELLYGWLGFVVKKGKKGEITSDEEALKKLRIETKHPFLDMLLDHREHVKLKGFLDIKIDKDDLVYTSYNPCGTYTFRLSSSKSIINPFGSGNLQNIPSIARKIYIP